MCEIDKLLLRVHDELDTSNLSNELKNEITGVVNTFRREKKIRVREENILKIVFEYLDVPFKHNYKNRKRELVFARQVALFFLKKYTPKSLVELGNIFNKDHASVLHSIKTIKNLLETDKQVRYTIVDIERLITQDSQSIETEKLYRNIYKKEK